MLPVGKSIPRPPGSSDQKHVKYEDDGSVSVIIGKFQYVYPDGPRGKRRIVRKVSRDKKTGEYVFTGKIGPEDLDDILPRNKDGVGLPPEPLGPSAGDRSPDRVEKPEGEGLSLTKKAKRKKKKAKKVKSEEREMGERKPSEGSDSDSASRTDSHAKAARRARIEIARKESEEAPPALPHTGEVAASPQRVEAKRRKDKKRKASDRPSRKKKRVKHEMKESTSPEVFRAAGDQHKDSPAFSHGHATSAGTDHKSEELGEIPSGAAVHQVWPQDCGLAHPSEELQEDTIKRPSDPASFGLIATETEIGELVVGPVVELAEVSDGERDDGTARQHEDEQDPALTKYEHASSSPDRESNDGARCAEVPIQGGTSGGDVGGDAMTPDESRRIKARKVKGLGLGIPPGGFSRVKVEDEGRCSSGSEARQDAPMEGGAHHSSLIREFLARQKQHVRKFLDSGESGGNTEGSSAPDSDSKDADWKPPPPSSPDEGSVDDSAGKEEEISVRGDATSESELLPETVTVVTKEKPGNFRGRTARRRRPASGKEKSTCPISGCLFTGVNVRRHLRGHPHAFDEETLKRVLLDFRRQQGRKTGKERYEQLPCPLHGEETVDTHTPCKTKLTKRLDQHLVKRHGILRGSERYADLLNRARISRSRMDSPVESSYNFDEIVGLYTNQMEGRSTGKKQSEGTSLCHRSALKMLLPEISGKGIDALKAAGDKDGLIDKILAEKKARPRTLQVYLSSVMKFLQWLSQHEALLARLQLQYDVVQQCRTRCKFFAKSLQDDVKRDEVENTVEPAKEGEVLEPWMEVGFQDSEVVRNDTALAEEARTRRLTRTERVQVRDTLYLALTLDQIRRAGDVNCIVHAQALALIEKWESEGKPTEITYQMSVAGAKTAQYGGKTIINVTPRTWSLFRYYTLYVRPQFRHSGSSKYLIVSEVNEERLSCAAVTKAYRRPWERYGRSLGIVLPTLTASMSRSMNVTLHRESGASADSQRLLAAHMTHSETTATRYYDKSREVAFKRSKTATEDMRGLRQQAASAASERESLRQAAVRSKPLHGLGASETELSSSEEEAPIPRARTEYRGGYDPRSKKGGVPKRSKLQPTAAVEEGEGEAEMNTSDEPASDVERATPKAPRSRQSTPTDVSSPSLTDLASPTLTGLSWDVEHQALKEIFDKPIRQFLQTDHARECIAKSKVPSFPVRHINEVLLQSRHRLAPDLICLFKGSGRERLRQKVRHLCKQMQDRLGLTTLEKYDSWRARSEDEGMD